MVDAHIDSHTSDSSISKAIHGMLLATLLGYGSLKAQKIFKKKVVLAHHLLVLIGVRSFEEEEKLLLERLGVKIYFIDEVLDRGFDRILEEALSYLTKLTKFIRMSLDLDAFDPTYVPGTGCKEFNGMPQDFINAIKNISLCEKLVAFEIAEYNPILDHNLLTFNLIYEIIREL